MAHQLNIPACSLGHAMCAIVEPALVHVRV